MKTRTDFVSNSSSSSFILNQTDFIEYFKIEKQDIVDALIDLFGKEKYDEYVESHSLEGAKRIVEEKLKKCSSKQEADWESEYYFSDDYLNSEPFYVYDLEDPNDAIAAVEKFGNLLEGWDRVLPKLDDDFIDEDCKNIVSFRHFLESINESYGCFLHQGNARELSRFGRIYDFKRARALKKIPFVGNWLSSKFSTKKLPSSLKKVVAKVRTELGIMSNLDVLKDEFSRFFIHFDDNYLGMIKGMDEHSKIDLEKYSYLKDDKDTKVNEIFATEAYSCDRFMDILLNYWISKGKVKLDDEDFLKKFEYSVKGSNGKEYISSSLLNGKYTLKDFIEDHVATWNGHEG